LRGGAVLDLTSSRCSGGSTASCSLHRGQARIIRSADSRTFNFVSQGTRRLDDSCTHLNANCQISSTPEAPLPQFGHCKQVAADCNACPPSCDSAGSKSRGRVEARIQVDCHEC
jgi:hypothetical protein